MRRPSSSTSSAVNSRTFFVFAKLPIADAPGVPGVFRRGEQVVMTPVRPAFVMGPTIGSDTPIVQILCHHRQAAPRDDSSQDQCCRLGQLVYNRCGGVPPMLACTIRPDPDRPEGRMAKKKAVRQMTTTTAERTGQARLEL